MKPTLVILMLLGFFVARAQEKATIEIEIYNIDNGDGQILIGLYDSKEHWLKKIYKGTFGKIENGKSNAVFTNVPKGTYAISVFHDEDNDGELDTFLGIPTEDTGTSNNAPAKFGPPKWSDAKFELRNETIKQSIKL